MITKANRNDITRLSEIHVYGWRHAYKNIISDEELFKNINVERSKSIFSKIINEEKENLDIYNDGIVKGFVIHDNSRDSDCDNSYEVKAIYVEPAFINNGIGKQLLKNAEESCIKSNLSKISIWVLEENLKARKFYEKNGYTQDGSEKTIESWGVKEIRYSKKLK